VAAAAAASCNKTDTTMRTPAGGQRAPPPAKPPGSPALTAAVTHAQFVKLKSSPLPPAHPPGRAAAGDPAKQLQALLAIRAAVDRGGGALPEWSQSSGGGGGGGYCRWPGVTCEGSDVVGVSIYGRGGSTPAPWGALPPVWTLQALPALRWLKVDGWGIKGSLPGDYGGLGGLQELVLTVDGYGGGIPSEWSGMTSLKRLVLRWVCFFAGARVRIGSVLRVVVVVVARAAARSFIFQGARPLSSA
jgi:hypothetical protein